MSERKPLAVPGEIAYLYDGSLAGFYCCVHACVYSHRIPLDMISEGQAQMTLLAPTWVETEADKALRVREAIVRKIAPRALEMVENTFLSCLEQKEMAMLRFLLLGFQEGRCVVDMLAHPDVAILIKAERHLLGEQHLLKGFVRFAEHEGKLIATIGPKNFVLPGLAPHFVDRYARETFMIYDETHKAALIHAGGSTDIVQMENTFHFEISERERNYQALWKQFYNTIGIEARENPRCRMGHMPKRYWAYMTEMKDLL